MDFSMMKDFLILLDQKYKSDNIKEVNGKMVYSDNLLKRYYKWMNIRNQRIWSI